MCKEVCIGCHTLFTTLGWLGLYARKQTVHFMCIQKNTVLLAIDAQTEMKIHL